MSKLPYPNQSNLLITVTKSQEDKSNHTLGQRRSYPNNVTVNCINSKEFTVLLRHGSCKGQPQSCFLPQQSPPRNHFQIEEHSHLKRKKQQITFTHIHIHKHTIMDKAYHNIKNLNKIKQSNILNTNNQS